jgi:RNA polymerase sigma-70 factor (ECF subfamily)
VKDLNTEKKLLARAKKLDKQTLAVIYDEYSPMIYRYAYRQLGDQYFSEECVAETFDRFLRALHNGKGPSNYIKAYLFRIAHNWITDHWRRHVPTEELDLSIVAENKESMETVVIDRLDIARIRASLQKLTPEQRQIIILKYIEGWSNREIAELSGQTIGAVKAMQFRGLQAMKKLLDTQGKDLR